MNFTLFYNLILAKDKKVESRQLFFSRQFVLSLLVCFLGVFLVQESFGQSGCYFCPKEKRFDEEKLRCIDDPSSPGYRPDSGGGELTTWSPTVVCKKGYKRRGDCCYKACSAGIDNGTVGCKPSLLCPSGEQPDEKYGCSCPENSSHKEGVCVCDNEEQMLADGVCKKDKNQISIQETQQLCLKKIQETQSCCSSDAQCGEEFTQALNQATKVKIMPTLGSLGAMLLTFSKDPALSAAGTMGTLASCSQGAVNSAVLRYDTNSHHTACTKAIDECQQVCGNINQNLSLNCANNEVSRNKLVKQEESSHQSSAKNIACAVTLSKGLLKQARHKGKKYPKPSINLLPPDTARRVKNIQHKSSYDYDSPLLSLPDDKNLQPKASQNSLTGLNKGKAHSSGSLLNSQPFSKPTSPETNQNPYLSEEESRVLGKGFSNQAEFRKNYIGFNIPPSQIKKTTSFKRDKKKNLAEELRSLLNKDRGLSGSATQTKSKIDYLPYYIDLIEKNNEVLRTICLKGQLFDCKYEH